MYRLLLPLALALVGCIPAAHLELQDGSIVSIYAEEWKGPDAGPNPTVRRNGVRVQRLDTEILNNVGLKAQVYRQELKEQGADGEPVEVVRRILEVTNATDKPIALKRIRAYAHGNPKNYEELKKVKGKIASGENFVAPAACDPKKGFSGLEVDGMIVDFGAETPGFTHRLLNLAQPWRIEQDGTLIQPLPGLTFTNEPNFEIEIPKGYVAPGAAITLRPLGGGKTIAVGKLKRETERKQHYAFPASIPPMFPLEIAFKAAPDVPKSGPNLLLFPIFTPNMNALPVYAFEGVKELDRDLAPGETLEFVMRETHRKPH